MALVSVVVPAHDEARVLERCLRPLAGLASSGEAEIVVVANGCSDDTAQVARSFPGVRAIELAAASKSAALNAGDDVAETLPRIYLDADIVITAEAVRALTGALAGPRPLVAAPRVVFRTAGRPWPVRAFYQAYTRMPYVTEGLVGLGVYAVNAAGRARFDRFPTLMGDDLFVQRHFQPDERVVLPDHAFVVETPRTLRSLVQVRTRTATGNRQLAAAVHDVALADGGTGPDAFARSTGASLRGLGATLLREPALLPAAAVYCGVTAASRWSARHRSVRWERDETTR